MYVADKKHAGSLESTKRSVGIISMLNGDHMMYA